MNLADAAPPRGVNSLLMRGAFPLGRLLIGRRFAESLQDLTRAQWMQPHELRERTEVRLAPLLRHAAEHVPYYRDVLGLQPGLLRGIEDLRKFPVVNKTVYRREPPEVFFAENVPSWFRLERTTSGSTGEPLQFSLDRRAVPVIFASHLFYDSWFGLHPFARHLRIVAHPATKPLTPDAPPLFRLRQWFVSLLQRWYDSLTQERITITDVDPAKAELIWRRMEASRPAYVLGYTSTLAVVADELLKRNLQLSRPLRAVVAIAEMLSPSRRRLIEEYFGAPIVNRYGLRELGSWSAQSCPASPARFHVNTELVAWEILREDGTPAEPGETGRLVLTDLWNYARPFIRYDTGDLAVAAAGLCECGRGFPVLAALEGRSQECIRTPAGRVIGPVSLGGELMVNCGHTAWVRHYQLVQTGPAQATLLVVPGPGYAEADRARLRDDVQRVLGSDMTVAVELVEEIPYEASGKRPIIKIAQFRPHPAVA